MSTSPSPSSSTGNSPSTTQTAASAHAQRRAGAPGAPRAAGGDLFAQLLGLLSAGGETPGLTTDTGTGDAEADTLNTTADDTATSASTDPQNPLAAMLAWAGQAMPMHARHAAPKDARAAADRDEDTTRASGMAAQGRTAAKTLSATGQATPDGASTRLAHGGSPATAQPWPTEAGTASNRVTDVAAAELGKAMDITASGAPSRTAAAAATATPATRITAWRSTATMAQAGTAAAHGSSTAHAAQAASHGQPATQASAAATQPAQTDAVAANAVPAAATTSAEAVTAPSVRAGHGPAAERSGPDAVASAPPGSGQDTSGAMAGGSGGSHADHGHHGAAAPADPQPPGTDAQVDTTPWTSPHVRHANVRVGDDGNNPIDIQLSVDGQAVQVSFQTDDAQTRESLAREAGAALGERLQRSGMELGSVSVGGQSQPSQQQAGSGHQPAPQHTHQQAAGASRAQVTSQHPEGPALPSARRDGGRPLDVFA